LRWFLYSSLVNVLKYNFNETNAYFTCLAGLDLVLDKLRVAGADFSSVKAISGLFFSRYL
jgi:hypothetical protein